MLIPNKSDQPESSWENIPSEVKIWVDKGWTIVPSERRGYVISGPKTMSSVDKIGLTVGAVLLLGFVISFMLLGILGVILIAGALLDFKFISKPPTKFFPEPGEKKRVMERE